MRKFICLVAAGCMATAGITRAEPEMKGTPSELGQYLTSTPGHVTISASAEIKAEANRAVLRLRINSKEKLLAAALEKNHKDRDTIVRTLTAQGLTKDDFRISKFSSTPSYGFFSKKPGAFEISSTVEVRATNEKDVQVVAVLIDSMPDVTLESFTFEHTDKDKLLQKAIADAIDKINVEKKLYEEKLGVTLRARGIPTSSNPMPMPISRVGAISTLGGYGGAAGERKSVDVDTSQFDQVVYSSQISVTFDVISREAGK